MMVSKKLLLSLMVAALVGTTGLLSAHELVLKPEKASAPAGSDVRIDLISTHVFLKADEVENVDSMKMAVLGASCDELGPVTADEPGKTLFAVLKVKSDKPALVALERSGELYGITNKGGKGGRTRKQLEADGLKVKSVNLYSKYAKLLFNNTLSDDTWKTVAGQDLEIVPLSNPADLKVGDFLDVKVLHHGSPESVNVWATYDGFAPYENTYAYYTEGNPEGVAHVKITHPGLWFIRVTSTEKGVEGEYDTRVVRSTLSFEVK